MTGTDEEVKLVYLCKRTTNLRRYAMIALLRQYNIFFNAKVWNLRNLTF